MQALSNKLFGSILAATLIPVNEAAQVLFDDFGLKDTEVVDPRPPCEDQPFCDRFRQFVDHPDLRAQSDVFYSLDADSVVVNDDSTITG